MAKNININGVNRSYYVTGNIKSTKALLVFHGGGENAGYGENGILGYSDLNNADALVISFNGQSSNNGYTWINAFPWLNNTSSYNYYNNRSQNMPDDILFVIKVLENYKNIESIYATGKSDGAGFIAFIIQNYPSEIPIKAAGTCSIALFYTSNNSVKLPLLSKIPFLEIHGTNDTVMPFNGQKFRNAPASTVWKLVDPSMNNTYTSGPYDWLSDNNNANVINLSNNNKIYKWSNSILVSVNGGDHDWFGNSNSGPNSNTSYSLSIDATSVILKFLDIDYITQPSSLPSYLNQIPTYNNKIIENYSSSSQYNTLMTLGIITFILSLFFIIWSIIILIRCSGSKSNKSLFIALLTLIILSLFFSWIPGLGQLLSLALFITVIIGTISC